MATAGANGSSSPTWRIIATGAWTLVTLLVSALIFNMQTEIRSSRQEREDLRVALAVLRSEMATTRTLVLALMGRDQGDTPRLERFPWELERDDGSEEAP